MAISPKITVLMSVYNGFPFLNHAITSILNQTYKAFEFLIIDDASTDNSCDLIDAFKDSRIRLVRNHKNLGQANSLNKGIHLARSPFIARIDQDDISMPNRLEKQFIFMDSNPNVAVAGTWLNTINESGQLLDTWRGNINCYSEFLFSLLLATTTFNLAFEKRKDEF